MVRYSMEIGDNWCHLFKLNTYFNFHCANFFYAQQTLSATISTIWVFHFQGPRSSSWHTQCAQCPHWHRHCAQSIKLNVVFNWFGAGAKLHAFVSFLLLSLVECAYLGDREAEEESGSESPSRWECLTVRKSIWCKLLRAQECVWPLLSCSRLGSEGWQVDASLDSPSNTH